MDLARAERLNSMESGKQAYCGRKYKPIERRLKDDPHFKRGYSKIKRGS